MSSNSIEFTNNLTNTVSDVGFAKIETPLLLLLGGIVFMILLGIIFICVVCNARKDNIPSDAIVVSRSYVRAELIHKLKVTTYINGIHTREATKTYCLKFQYEDNSGSKKKIKRFTIKNVSASMFYDTEKGDVFNFTKVNYEHKNKIKSYYECEDMKDIYRDKNSSFWGEFQ